MMNEVYILLRSSSTSSQDLIWLGHIIYLIWSDLLIYLSIYPIPDIVLPCRNVGTKEK